jgi:hypothetical protein
MKTERDRDRSASGVGRAKEPEPAASAERIHAAFARHADFYEIIVPQCCGDSALGQTEPLSVAMMRSARHPCCRERLLVNRQSPAGCARAGVLLRELGASGLVSREVQGTIPSGWER